MTTINTIDLKLGDVVRRKDLDGPWTTCIVKNVTETQVTLFRPYGHKADFSYTSGVICYTGIEEYDVEHSRDIQWILFERVTLK